MSPVVAWTIKMNIHTCTFAHVKFDTMCLITIHVLVNM